MPAPGTARSAVTTTPVARPATLADQSDGPGRVERTDRAEERGRGAGLAELRVDGARHGHAGVELLGDGRGEATVGVGEGPRADVEGGELLADVAECREEHLFAEEPRVVEVAGRGLGVAAVAAEVRVGARDVRAERRRAVVGDQHDGRGTCARPLLERRPRPGTVESETTTSATRAEPAPTASAAPSSASMPACGEPEQSAPPDLVDRPIAAASTAWLGPSANGGREVPHQRPSTMSVCSPDAAIARPGGLGREREDVLVGGAHGGLAPAPLAAPGRGDLGGGEAVGGRSRADGKDVHGVAHGPDAYRTPAAPGAAGRGVQPAGGSAGVGGTPLREGSDCIVVSPGVESVGRRAVARVVALEVGGPEVQHRARDGRDRGRACRRRGSRRGGRRAPSADTSEGPRGTYELELPA